MTASSPPPADDKVREAAVEAVARHLWPSTWDVHPAVRPNLLAGARDLLSLPAVSALLTEARADELDGQSRILRAVHRATAGRADLPTIADKLASRATHLRAAVRQTDERNDR